MLEGGDIESYDEPIEVDDGESRIKGLFGLKAGTCVDA